MPRRALQRCTRCVALHFPFDIGDASWWWLFSRWGCVRSLLLSAPFSRRNVLPLSRRVLFTGSLSVAALDCPSNIVCVGCEPALSLNAGFCRRSRPEILVARRLSSQQRTPRMTTQRRFTSRFAPSQPKSHMRQLYSAPRSLTGADLAVWLPNRRLAAGVDGEGALLHGQRQEASLS
jgi:hypothetical protein